MNRMHHGPTSLLTATLLLLVAFSGYLVQMYGKILTIQSILLEEVVKESNNEKKDHNQAQVGGGVNEAQDRDGTVSINISSESSQTNTHHDIKRKPVLYLHVGPPKTATTTIQAGLTEYRNKLVGDNIVFLGKDKKEKWLRGKSGKMFPQPSWCTIYLQYQEKVKGISPNCLYKMNETIFEYHRSGRDVIMSDEVLGTMFSKKGERKKRSLKGLHEFADLIGDDWDVRILLGYRPYFDYVTSQFNEKWEIKPAKAKMNKWPTQGGRSVPLVKDSWDSTGVCGGWAGAIELANVFSTVFKNNTVFDITQPGDLMTYFFCDILENAHQTCKAKKRSVASGTRTKNFNVATPLDYDMLATAASRKGLFNLTLKRKSVVAKIRQYHEDEQGLKVIDFPLICPSTSHSMALFNASIAQERTLFPDRGDGNLKAIFQKRLDTKAFCNIDVDKVLEDETWIKFFRSL